MTPGFRHCNDPALELSVGFGTQVVVSKPVRPFRTVQGGPDGPPELTELTRVKGGTEALAGYARNGTRSWEGSGIRHRHFERWYETWGYHQRTLGTSPQLSRR